MNNVALGLLLFGLAYSLRKLHALNDTGVLDEFDAATPETPATDVRTVGDEFDTRLTRAFTTEQYRAEAEDEIRETLREKAVDAYHHHESCDRDTATHAVTTGEWTPHRIPAAFLGDETAPQFTLWERIKAWFLPAEMFQTRVQKTVVAIHTLTEDTESAFANQHSPSKTGSVFTRSSNHDDAEVTPTDD
ncbi:DUF7269 family protein [Salinibaculum rarum]|uniref:DUF7269 family protein n=1 Tax=Salinibaculum rarum TaxID=3058903 RepID=UPI0026602295|nr:hypothetical protein [Salinibaculum sp. KK48]